MAQYVDVRRENGYSEVIANGIPYRFDDRTGSSTIWNISLFLDGIPEPRDPEKSFSEFHKLLTKDKSSIVIKQVMKIHPDAYKLNFLSEVQMKIIGRLCKPGRSSISSITSVYDSKSGNVLMERYHKFGFIDNATRRTVKHPDWFIEKYSDPALPETPSVLSKTDISAPPSDCFEYKSVIRFSDIDVNFHTNQSVYIKFCLDCAALASYNEKLVHFKGDIERYPVLDISIDYIGECFARDEIRVLLWQDENDVSKLSFWVLKDKSMLTFIVCHFGMNPIKGSRLSSKY